jgi:hypothetical protein
MDIMNEIGDFGDAGGYDLDEIKKAKEALGSNTKDVSTAGMQEVDPLYIEVLPHNEVHHTEEYEARMVIIEYNEYDEIIGVELL